MRDVDTILAEMRAEQKVRDARLKTSLRKELEKMNDDGYLYIGKENFALCPHCGKDFNPVDWEAYESSSFDCYNCEKEFHLEIEYKPFYTVWRK